MPVSGVPGAKSQILERTRDLEAELLALGECEGANDCAFKRQGLTPLIYLWTGPSLGFDFWLGSWQGFLLSANDLVQAPMGVSV
jgi:hypothetical protein